MPLKENGLRPKMRKSPEPRSTVTFVWLRGQDLNLGPLGYEPNELPDCSTPQTDINNHAHSRQTKVWKCEFDVSALELAIRFERVLLRFPGWLHVELAGIVATYLVKKPGEQPGRDFEVH